MGEDVLRLARTHERKQRDPLFALWVVLFGRLDFFLHQFKSKFKLLIVFVQFFNVFFVFHLS